MFYVADSSLNFAEAVSGSTAPEAILATLRLVEVTYYGFDGRLHMGQLVVSCAVEEDVREIFSLIREVRFPVNAVVPIVRYNWSDEASMEANNSSAFNYRVIAGTNRLSRHALGLAVDLNPRQNPMIYENGQILPSGAIYQQDAPGTLTESSLAVQAFLQRGWHWGGHFQHVRDYHHFEHGTIPSL
ncbi:D-alanyl-D-alanine carboxypeptidase [Syntrophus gentianae]|uniref:D-alanyl-D-alanine carboxypeptidase n=1 Tax=Syntrophus gentianae TaxID=43775 RepID=A0A1H7ZAP7_9BACT|nr:M15 family metallopeptidase [Syntrophus gentianae]SEM55074.1 D-alanyl-D-alanine carboxypeptidase [Syntrophus gentianae]